MAPNSFRLFTQLPKELRDMIWTAALNPAHEPAVHFFDVILPESPSRSSYTDNVGCSMSGYTPAPRAIFREDHTLYPPKPRPVPISPYFEESKYCGSDTYWFNGRQWTYKILSRWATEEGLWTACLESREVVKRRHAKALLSWSQGPQPNANTRLEDWHPEYDYPPVPGNFWLEDGTIQYFSIASEDLVVYQVNDISTDLESQTMPFRLHDEHHRRTVTAGKPFIGPNIRQTHVAVEFNPAWVDPRQREYYLIFFHDLARLHGGGLWFIDYAIPKETITKLLARNRAACDDPARCRSDNECELYPGQTPMVFHGRGCRFVQVRSHRQTYRSAPPGPVGDLSGGEDEWLNSSHPVFKFVRDVEYDILHENRTEHLLEDLSPPHEELGNALNDPGWSGTLLSDHPDWALVDDLPWFCDIGVLACEYLSDEE